MLNKTRFLIFVILIFLGMKNVYAETYTCQYGTLKNGNWEKKYEFDINIQRGSSSNSVAFTLKKNLSPEMLSIASSDEWQSKDNIFTVAKLFENKSASTNYTIYPQLYNKRILEILFENEPAKDRYDNENDYKEAMRKHYCLTSIKKEVVKKEFVNANSMFGWLNLNWGIAISGVSLFTSNLYVLHASDMTINDLQDESNWFKEAWDWWYGNKESVKVEHLIEIGSKDLDPKVLDADCSTFNIYMSGIQNAAANGCDGNSEFDKRYIELTELCNSYRETAHYATSNANGQVQAKSCSTACSYLYSQIDKICGKSSNNAACGSLGHKIVSWLFKIIKFVRYAIPALLIILSILDYIKAIASDSEDEMKKVISRFSKRLVAAALIFIIPFVLEFILNIFNLPGLNADNIFCAK